MGINKKFIYAFLGAGILVGMLSTFLLLRNTTDTSSNADTVIPPDFTLPSPSPSPIVSPPADSADASCEIPETVSDVKVEFPGCDGDECSFTQASCAWGEHGSASEFQVKITEVESGNVVREQRYPADTTKIIFEVTQNKTYKCEVKAVSACGSVSEATSDQLTCSVDGLVPSTTPEPTPTTVVVNTPTPTTAIPTPTPTLPPTGPEQTLVIGGIMGALLIMIGGILFLL